MDHSKSPGLDADDQTILAGLRVGWLPEVIAVCFSRVEPADTFVVSL
jgi:hypothetical protein